MRVFDSAGKPLFESDLSRWGAAAKWNGPLPAPGKAEFRTIPTDNAGIEARRIEGYVGQNAFVLMGVTNEPKTVVLQTFQDRFFEVFLLLIFVSITGAWVIARRSMRGIDMLTVTAETIAGGDLAKRITGDGYGNEIDRLASVFNRIAIRN